MFDGVDQTAAASTSAQAVRLSLAAPLDPGVHVVEVRHAAETLQWTFRIASALTIADVFPADLVLAPGIWPTISARFDSPNAAIDPDSIMLQVDGADVTAAASRDGDHIQFRGAQPFAEGRHDVTLSVRDTLGASATAAFGFTIAAVPSLSAPDPQNRAELLESPAAISIRYEDTAFPVDPASVRWSINGDPIAGDASVVPDAGGGSRLRLVPASPLSPGEHLVTVSASNAAGAPNFAQWSFVLKEQPQYDLQILSPQASTQVHSNEVTVALQTSASRTHPVQIEVNGVTAAPKTQADRSVHYEATVPIQTGNNVLRARVTFADGEVREASRDIERLADLSVTITAPTDFTILGPVTGSGPIPGGATNLTGAVQRGVTVSGVTSVPVQEVSINQQQAVLTADGLGFNFPNFFLHEGTNLLGVVARDALGRTATAQITVYVDQTAPLLTVESPPMQAVTSQQVIDVRGVVNDSVSGRVGVTWPAVAIRNLANQSLTSATVSNLGYLATNVPLEVGQNVLTVSATDAQGNTRSENLVVVRTAVGTRRLALIGGDRQRAPAGASLLQPLIVQALNEAAEPLVDEVVRFDVKRGTGVLRQTADAPPTDGPTPVRNLEVRTDSQGQAMVWLRLGQDAREGSDVVEASIAAFPETVTFTASAAAGAAHRIGVYGQSGTQYVPAFGTPIEALMTQVLDALDNPVANANVIYRIEAGSGSFDPVPASVGLVAPDGRSIRLQTDLAGIAAARPRMGGNDETLSIRATVLDSNEQPIGNAEFQLISLAPADGPTGLSGVVLSHDGRPLANVRLSIGRTQLTQISDAAGRFQFEDLVPPGKVDLFVDGRDVQVAGNDQTIEYPALHFEAAIVAGRTNQLPHPIYLPPVETGRAIQVGGDADAVLTLPGFEGFSMRVPARSVTFPDGSPTGELVVTAVHADRLPMVPPGLSGRFATLGWTIQPTGTRFDPPIEVRIPNTDGLAPGRALPIVQWDHDLAAFVPMGQGTVSEDGTQIVSDPGSGITKAGWGGGGPPPPPDNCGTDGREPEIRSVRVKAFGTPNENDEPLLLLTDQPTGRARRVGLEMQIDAVNCPEMTVGWDLGDRLIEDRRRITLEEFTEPGTYSATPFVDCKRRVCDQTLSAGKDGDPRKVHVVRFKLESGFSEQTENAQANGFKRGLAGDNATGYAERPYALMGVRSDDRGCLRLEYVLEGSSEGKDKVREKLRFGFGQSARVLGDSGPDCSGAGQLTDETAYLSMASPPFVSMWPVAGLDANDDDRLDYGEVDLHKYQWLYLIVSDATRAQGLAAFNAAAANFGGLGQAWLYNFRDGTVPYSGTADESYTISRAEPGLAHANGARFPPGPFVAGKRGESRRVTHGANTQIVRAMLDSPNMRGWLVDGVRAHEREILNATMSAPGQVVTSQFLFTNDPTAGALHTLDKATFWRSGTGGVQGGIPYPDLYAAIGDAQNLKLTVKVHAVADLSQGINVNITGIEVVGGTLSDIFDFDHDVRILGIPVGGLVPSLGPLARAGAQFQGAHLGKSSSRPGGLVYLNIYEFGWRAYPGFNLVYLTTP